MNEQQIEPIYLVAKNVIQQANNQFKNVHILNNADNIPPQFLLSNNSKPQFNSVEPPPLPYRPIKQSIVTKKSIAPQLANLKEQSKELYDNLKDFFTLSTELTFRLIILFVIYISIIYNLYRCLASLYLIESNFRLSYFYLSNSKRTIYSIFMLFNLFVDCYGVYTLLKKNIVIIFFYAITLTAFSLFLLILFGLLAGTSVLLSLFIASLCYLFTYVEYRQLNESDGVCQSCIHNHIMNNQHMIINSHHV